MSEWTKETFNAFSHYFFAMFIIASVLVILSIIHGCSNAGAAAETIKCEMIVTPVVWQADTVCGFDKENNQMVSVGTFTNPNRTGCVSLQRQCVISQ